MHTSNIERCRIYPLHKYIHTLSFCVIYIDKYNNNSVVIESVTFLRTLETGNLHFHASIGTLVVFFPFRAKFLHVSSWKSFNLLPNTLERVCKFCAPRHSSDKFNTPAGKTRSNLSGNILCTYLQIEQNNEAFLLLLWTFRGLHCRGVKTGGFGGGGGCERGEKEGERGECLQRLDFSCVKPKKNIQ